MEICFFICEKTVFSRKKTIFDRFFAFFRVPGGTQVSLKSPEVGPKKRQMGLCGPLGAPGSSRDPFWSHFGCPRGGIWGSPGTPWGYFFDTNSSVFDFHEFSRNSQLLSRKLAAKKKHEMAVSRNPQPKEANNSKKTANSSNQQQTAVNCNNQQQTGANSSKYQQTAAYSSE